MKRFINGINEEKYEIHLKSPLIGDIVRCTNPERQLNDPMGYRVENLGIKNGYGVEYGAFTARGIKYGGLYHFNVFEYEKINV